MNQSYQKELFEVIIVDDDSNDKTAEIVMQFKEKWDNIPIVVIDLKNLVNFCFI